MYGTKSAAIALQHYDNPANSYGTIREIDCANHARIVLIQHIFYGRSHKILPDDLPSRPHAGHIEPSTIKIPGLIFQPNFLDR